MEQLTVVPNFNPLNGIEKLGSSFRTVSPRRLSQVGPVEVANHSQNPWTIEYGLTRTMDLDGLVGSAELSKVISPGQLSLIGLSRLVAELSRRG
jgi:hypothetical protein